MAKKKIIMLANTVVDDEDRFIKESVETDEKTAVYLINIGKAEYPKGEKTTAKKVK